MKLVGLLLLLLIMPLPATAQSGGAQKLDDLLEATAEFNRISAQRADERIKLLEAFIKKYPHSSLKESAREALMRARAALAESLLKQQRPEPAVEQFQRAYETIAHPASERVFNNLIWVFPATLLSYGYRQEGIELMRKFESAYSNEAARLAQIALFYLNAEAGKDATRVLKRAVELAPKEDRYYFSLGSAYLMQLNLAEAKAAYQRAIDLEPKHTQAYSALATIYRAEGALEDALSLYRKQLEVAPDSDAAHGGLAITHLIANDEAQATAELGKFIAAAPRDFHIFTQVAFFAVSQKDYGRARRWVDMALTIAPHYAWARIVKSNLLVAQGDYNGAEELLSDALARGTAFNTLYIEITKALLLAENFSGAYEQMESYFIINENGEFEIVNGSERSATLRTFIQREQRAALGMPVSITNDEQIKLLEAFLRFEYYLRALAGQRDSSALQTRALKALAEFLSVADERRPYRQLWAAARLLESNVALERAAELCAAALKEAESATRAAGSVRDAPDLDGPARLKLYQARAQLLMGRIRFQQDQLEEADRLMKLATDGFGEGAEFRAALARRAAVKQAAGRDQEALELYLRAFNSHDENARLQRTIIENLYRKVHGSLEGLKLN